jgi:hypothetical protein
VRLQPPPTAITTTRASAPSGTSVHCESKRIFQQYRDTLLESRIRIAKHDFARHTFRNYKSRRDCSDHRRCISELRVSWLDDVAGLPVCGARRARPSVSTASASSWSSALHFLCSLWRGASHLWERSGPKPPWPDCPRIFDLVLHQTGKPREAPSLLRRSQLKLTAFTSQSERASA